MTMLDSDFVLLNNFVIYGSKFITDQKWLFISYNLCDFIANTKHCFIVHNYVPVWSTNN